MPVDRLRDLARGKVTFAPLIDAGLETVGKILAAGADALRRIPGVRRRAARRIMAAAAQMRESVEDGTRVRIDPDARTPEQTALIAALRRYERSRSALKGPDLSPLASEIGRRLDPAARGASRPRCCSRSPGGRSRKPATPSPSWTPSSAPSPSPRPASGCRGPRPSWRRPARNSGPTRLWNDYLARPVTYNGLLIDVAELDPAREASQGFLPADIAEQVRVSPSTSRCSRRRCAATRPSARSSRWSRSG